MDKEPIDDFGVIVNDRDGQQPKEFNTDEAVLPIRVPHDIFDKFIRAAAFQCADLIQLISPSCRDAK